MTDETQTEQTEQTSLVNIDEILAAQAKQIASNLATGIASISTKGGRFVFPDETKRDGPLSMVVLAAVLDNQLWNGNEMNNTPKIDSAYESGIICSAVSDETLDKKNMISFESAPCRVAESCQNCPQNLWDNSSKPARRIGQCKNTLTMAVMHADPEFDSTIYLLRTSPTGTTEAAKAYAKLRQLYGHPIRGQVTLDFVPTPKGADRLRVQAGQSNPHYAKHFHFMDEGWRMVKQEPRWASRTGATQAQPAPANQPMSSGRASRSAAAA